jgi:hypothetical protein
MTLRLGIAVVIAAGGCSGASPAEPVGFSAAPYATAVGTDHRLQIEVRSSPQPPARGTNEVQLTIRSMADGTPLDGLKVAVKPWMPAMNHGTSLLPNVTPQGRGKYLITDLDLFMPGLWQLRLTITGASADQAAPSFEIP